MKNLLKASLMLLFLFVVSCSKSDNDQPDKLNEAIIKVEVTNNQSSNFEEILNIQIVGNNISTTEVTGTTWDDKQTPSANAKWFIKQGDVKPTIVYQTTNKVTSLTYAVVITSKPAPTTPLITTLKFYADDKLIKTETVNTINKSDVSIPIVVTN
jgi:hypothetical protein